MKSCKFLVNTIYILCGLWVAFFPWDSRWLHLTKSHKFTERSARTDFYRKYMRELSPLLISRKLSDGLAWAATRGENIVRAYPVGNLSQVCVRWSAGTSLAIAIDFRETAKFRGYYRQRVFLREILISVRSPSAFRSPLLTEKPCFLVAFLILRPDKFPFTSK